MNDKPEIKEAFLNLVEAQRACKQAWSVQHQTERCVSAANAAHGAACTARQKAEYAVNNAQNALTRLIDANLA